MLLDRNNPTGFDKTQIATAPMNSMEGVGTLDPYSGNFVCPEWLKAKPHPYQLVDYMAKSNEQKGYKLPGEFRWYLKTAKNLLDQYDIDLLARTIWYCGQVTHNPFTFKFVREYLERNTR